MLQLGHNGYEYSCGKRSMLPSQEQMEKVFPTLAAMAWSKKYLLQTSGDWFKYLLEHGVEEQNWKCNTKASLTIDSDGTLKHCVDVPLEVPLTIFDLERVAGQIHYERLIKEPKCEGCLWDSAYDSIRRGQLTLGEDEARRWYRHELTEKEVANLVPEARWWFKKREWDK